MRNDISKWCALIMGLLLGTAVAVAQGQGATGVKVNPGTMQKKAQSPPPANATETTSVGNNVKMATPAGSVSWAEQLDVDGDGQVDQATLAWDAKDRVLFSNTTGSFTCSNGAPGSGELLIAVNGAGNRWNRPVGSGFWVANLDKGQSEPRPTPCGDANSTLPATLLLVVSPSLTRRTRT
jgi:hypothetical protein